MGCSRTHSRLIPWSSIDGWTSRATTPRPPSIRSLCVASSSVTSFCLRPPRCCSPLRSQTPKPAPGGPREHHSHPSSGVCGTHRSSHKHTELPQTLVRKRQGDRVVALLWGTTAVSRAVHLAASWLGATTGGQPRSARSRPSDTRPVEWVMCPMPIGTGAPSLPPPRVGTLCHGERDTELGSRSPRVH